MCVCFDETYKKEKEFQRVRPSKDINCCYKYCIIAARATTYIHIHKHSGEQQWMDWSPPPTKSPTGPIYSQTFFFTFKLDENIRYSHAVQ